MVVDKSKGRVSDTKQATRFDITPSCLILSASAVPFHLTIDLIMLLAEAQSLPLVAPSSFGGIFRAKQTRVGMYGPLAWPTIDNGDTSASQAIIKSVEANIHLLYLTRGNVPTMDLDVDELSSQDLVD